MSLPARLCRAVLLLASMSAAAEPAVVVWPAIGTPSEVVIAGRVLKSRTTPGGDAVDVGLRMLAERSWAFAPVEVRGPGPARRTTTDVWGYFSVRFRADEGAGLPAGLSVVEARVPGATGAGVVQIVDDTAPFVVVTSLEDTLLAGPGGLAAAFAHPPGQHGAPVPGMAGFLRCLVEAKPARPGVVVVSDVPVQVLPRIRRALFQAGFPAAALALGQSAGPRGFVGRSLAQLAEELPRPLVLVGSSAGDDPEVYRAFSAAGGAGRVLVTYILDAGRATEPSRFAGQVLVKDARAAADDAAGRGLVSQACVRRELGR